MFRKTGIHICLLIIIAVTAVSHAAVPDTLVRDSRFAKQYSFKTQAEFIETDNVGNLYLISDDQIIKLNKQGDTMFVSSNKITGDISQVDLNFALKPLVFHKDQNSISILDNTLSQQKSIINLDDHDIYTPKAVCNSYSGNTIWVFNQDNYELFKINSELGVQYQSGNLKLQINEGVDITSMREYKNKLYANSPENGILVFDIFGTYVKTIPIKNCRSFQVYDEIILVQMEDGFYFYSSMDFTKSHIQTLAQYDQVKVNSEMMYTLKNGILTAFTFKK